MVKIGMSEDVREVVTVVRKCDSPKKVVSWWGGVMVMVRSIGA